MNIKYDYKISEPDVGDLERKYMNEAFDSGWISSKGPFISEFEDKFAKFVGAKYAVTCSNGTTALHLAIKSLGIKKGDEVIVPNLTFASPANAVIYEQGKPVLVDIDKRYWCLDPNKIEEKITDKTRAIIVVHLYGHPTDMEPVLKLSKKYNLKIIEDCAEAHGAKYKGKVVGSIGDIGCFSFYGNKIITTGEGGMVTTKDGSLVERIKLLRDHGMSPLKRYWHDEVGYNYRMTNIQAAIGVAQLESIKDKIHKHIWIAKKYSEYITESVKIQPEMPWALNVYWLPTFLMSDYNLSKYRELIMSSLLKKNIESRPVFYPLNEMPPYKNNILYENSKYVSYNGLSLPVSNKFDEDDIIRISDTFNKIIEKLKNG